MPVGRSRRLWPILPHDVTIERIAEQADCVFRIYNGTRTETLLQDEVLHIRSASRDGIIGLCHRLAIARGALSLALANAETAQDR